MKREEMNEANPLPPALFSDGFAGRSQFLRSIFQMPRPTTRSTTTRLRQVKTLLNLVDSFTPMDKMMVSKKVMAKATKSG